MSSATGETNGKAPMPGQSPNRSHANARNGEDPLVKVQPPRREDLQPSYAQVIKADTEDESQHGWYGCKWISYRIAWRK